MKILIACEESQTVCTAFREKGHEAYSCDIQECSGGHPEWHIHEDVIPILNGYCEFNLQNGESAMVDGKWDMIIAHPPCTHLAVSGAAWFAKKRQDGRQREGIELFCKFLTADCDRVAIENPVGIISGTYIMQYFPDLCEKYKLPRAVSQKIQPWMFGDNFAKLTCLWLKGLKPLKPIVTEAPDTLEYKYWVDENGKTKRQPQWFADAWNLPAAERQKLRSKTFPGIAKAMVDAWG